jgi:hypothetical protein
VPSSVGEISLIEHEWVFLYSLKLPVEVLRCLPTVESTKVPPMCESCEQSSGPESFFTLIEPDYGDKGRKGRPSELSRC